MFIYNQLTELTLLQLVPILVLLILGLVLGMVLLKLKPSFKLILLSLVIGILLSLVSGLIGWGGYSGMMYAERFGWPIQYLYENRTLEPSYTTVITVPFDIRFDFLRFSVNTLMYILSVLNILWFFSARKSQKNLRVHVLLLLTLLALLILSSFSLYNKYLVRLQSSMTKVEDDTEQKREPRARYLVETKYPEFKDFENQTSFAGKEVIVKTVGTTTYIAYATNGSGVRYVDTTCFSVTNEGVVKENRKYSQLTSSILPYTNTDLDPVTCTNIP